MIGIYNQNVVRATYLDEFRLVYHSFEDKPAVYYKSDAKEWYREGILHRDNDLPALIYKDKTKIWYQNGEVSRVNGPAIVWYGNEKHKTYCYRGKLLNPYNNKIEYPKTDEEKMGHLDSLIFIIKDKIPYIFNEYVREYDKKFYNKYKLLLITD